MRNITSLNILLERWLFWDGDLFAELSEVEMCILRHRLIERQSFDIVGIQVGVSEVHARLLFDTIVLKLQRAMGIHIADLLIELDDEIESYLRKLESPYGFDYIDIPTN